MKIILGISGATGVIMGYRLLELLRELNACEIHLIVSAAAAKNFELETNIKLEQVQSLADIYYENTNLASSIASGSFKTDGMIVLPCSMKTLSGIANGYADNLLVRAADVCLKENRKVVLAPREMPLSKVHLQNMSIAQDLGCTIIPPMLTFYNHFDSLDEQIVHIVGKILMQFNMDIKGFRAWQG